MKNLKKNAIFVLLLCVIVIAGLVDIGCVTVNAEAVVGKMPDNDANHSSQAATALFKADGSYSNNVTKASVIKGATFSFFGYEWTVVAVRGSTATFWMTAPYTTSYFNYNTNFGETQNIRNTWSSGYNYSTWNGQSTATSTIRQLLLDKAKELASQPGYDKIVPGAQSGLNDTDNMLTAPRSLYRKTDIYDHREGAIGSAIIINFSIGGSDKLWLPSYNEVKDGGTWDLADMERNWTGATSKNDETAWLRTPVITNEQDTNDPSYIIKDYTNAYKVGCSTTLPNGGSYDSQSIWYNWVDSASGVRPAVHLNIADLR
jgi:hypothetical protein